MKLKCVDGNTRDFITVYDLLVEHGFDPVFLEEDQYQVQLSFPPGLSIFQTLSLLKLGITPENCFWHWSSKHKKINPCHITLPELLKDIEWIALHKSLRFKTDNDLTGKSDLLTLFFRLLNKFWDFITLKSEKKFSLNFWVLGIDLEDFKFMTGHEYIDYQQYSENNQRHIYIKGSGDKNYLIDPSLFGHTKHVYVSLKKA